MRWRHTVSENIRVAVNLVRTWHVRVRCVRTDVRSIINLSIMGNVMWYDRNTSHNILFQFTKRCRCYIQNMVRLLLNLIRPHMTLAIMISHNRYDITLRDHVSVFSFSSWSQFAKLFTIVVNKHVVYVMWYDHKIELPPICI